MDRRILFLKQEVASNLQKQYSVEKLALSVNLSASHLQKLFKAETGMSAVQYVRHLKMEKARELLEGSFLLIKEIRKEVGAPDLSHFVRDFKVSYGLTPSEYRKQHWQKLEIENRDSKTDSIRH
ncbi:MAG TPA: AraC family transcriptional regulator [Pyrinomonadaceae bacterium]|jgi:AraC-like DNA-binding protein